ncbi:MAG: hypothetical protein IJR83_00935 [Clostridia bacterium]|nr:hypothetical protein [Clostridia bacterium]
MEKNSTVGAQRLSALFDAGTFVEIGAYLKRPGSDEREAVVCGYGAVNGKLVFAFSQDSDRIHGAVDEFHAKKIEETYEKAIRNGAPVIGLFDSKGAVVYDGASALSSYSTLLGCVSRASGKIVQIAIVTGVCPGLCAGCVSMFDFVLTVAGKSEIYVNSPFLIGKDTGDAAYAAANGLSTLSASSEEEAYGLARKLVDLVPSDCNSRAEVEAADDVNRAVDLTFTSAGAYAAADAMNTLADAGSFIEIGKEFAPEMLTGLARFGGVSAGIVANNPAIKDGAVTKDGLRKAARMVSFCDCFGLPVVTLVDSAGAYVSKDEESGLAAGIGKLSMTYANASCALVTVMLGRAYGCAMPVMGSKALGADLVLALPGATAGILSPASAVAFLWNDRINADYSREDAEKEWTDKYASAEAIASAGAVDDIIEPAETRQRICAGIYMLLYKNSGVQGKHANLPL